MTDRAPLPSPAPPLARARRTAPPSRATTGRGAPLLLGAAVVVGLAVWAAPKVYRRLSGANLHQVWVIQRNQEVERYGDALQVFEELRLEIPPDQAGIGRLVADLSVELDDGPTTLEVLSQAGPTVFAHRAPDGPRHGDRSSALRALEQRYRPEGVRFVYLYTDPALDRATATSDRDAAELEGDVLLDPEGVLARELQVRTTSDVFLVDAGRTLVYRGAVDDARLAPDGTLDPGHRAFLARALDATLAARPVVLAATRAMGRPLSFDEPRGPRGLDGPVTWTNRVQRIVQQNCLSCHNADGVAPIQFESYEDVRGRRRMIRVVLEERSMPPWMAAEGTGPWRNGLHLPEEDRADLLAWIDAGAPEGDPSDAGIELNWPAWDEWIIGEPDYVVHAEEPIPIPSEGIIPIQKFTVETPFPEDRWVQAIQLLPSTKGVLHHATIFMQPPGGERLMFLDALLPGKTPTIYPEGQARFVPKGTKFKFIIHYTPNGAESEDLLRLGLRFAEAPPFREVHSIWMTNNTFVIPPHAKDYEVQAEFVLPRDVLLKQFMPHMHLRGVSFLAEAIQPDGEVVELLNLPRWNLDWQYAYELYEPIFLPEGTKILCTGTYDNTADNPANPDPGRAVPFGQQTFDEMLGFGMDFVDP